MVLILSDNGFNHIRLQTTRVPIIINISAVRWEEEDVPVVVLILPHRQEGRWSSWLGRSSPYRNSCLPHTRHIYARSRLSWSLSSLERRGLKPWVSRISGFSLSEYSKDTQKWYIKIPQRKRSWIDIHKISKKLSRQPSIWFIDAPNIECLFLGKLKT